jgi:hypothetical protein
VIVHDRQRRRLHETVPHALGDRRPGVILARSVEVVSKPHLAGSVADFFSPILTTRWLIVLGAGFLLLLGAVFIELFIIRKRPRVR